MRWAYAVILLLIVAGTTRADDVSFRNTVQPILAKFGCSAGACHGAAAGKNGLKLSLRGYDDEGDYRAITRAAQGRRIDLADPAKSLFVLKPLNLVPHKGGERIKPDSPECRLLLDWVAQGAPGPKADDPRIVRIELLPKQVVMKPGAERPLQVKAYFSDGRVEDVTRWAKYTSADTSVATIGEDGRVKAAGYGEGAITAWYLSTIAAATVTAPFDNAVPPETFASAPRRNFIDGLVLEKLASLNLPPSPRSTDEELVRRAFLDTIGILPTAAEVRAFLDDHSEAKRDRLIDALLERPEFIDYWCYKWSDLLLVSNPRLKPPSMWAYSNWIRQQVALNTHWDDLARQVVTATGNTLENGAGNFYLLNDDPTKVSETVSVTFLGMSINCAKCHNHPMEKWTNDQYFGMANLFARVHAKSAANGHQVIFSATEGDLVQPLSGKPRPPQPLDGKPLPLDWKGDRRAALADWLVSRDNPYFSRAIVNRVWANFMGVGLVESVDDMRKTNPASNEKLLDALAAYLADQRFDLKSLMRTILQSETYQRSSQKLEGNAADRRFYSHYYPKRLIAEVMLDAVSQVTAAPTPFKDYAPGTRAMQLPDTKVDSYFLKTFGRPDRMITCECERTSLPSMAQALHISNGDTVNQKLQAKGNRIDQLLAEKAGDDQIVEDAYLSALSRHPTADEKSKLLAALAEVKPESKREVIEDLYWGILSSNGFLFNH
ncbi:MAG: hypothetical protein JWN40_1505 [Phycisphaerales bacterium]|nr:hypothetical protein [Phycisphaerales bacterium]